MTLYWEVIRFRFLRFFAYPYEILAGLLRQVISIVSLSVLWFLALKGSANAQPFVEVLSYFLIAEGVKEITMGEWGTVGRLVSRSIREGTLSNFLMKPLSILPYLYSYAIGSNGLQIAVGIVSIIAGLFFFPNTSFVSLFLFIAFLIPAIGVGFAFNMFLGMIFFYINDGTGIRNSISHMTRIVSGAWIPLTYFPGQIREVVSLLPFQVMVYGPTNALKTTEITSEVINNLFIAYFWAVILLVGIKLWWNHSIKHYEAVGI